MNYHSIDSKPEKKPTKLFYFMMALLIILIGMAIIVSVQFIIVLTRMSNIIDSFDHLLTMLSQNMEMGNYILENIKEKLPLIDDIIQKVSLILKWLCQTYPETC